MKSVTQGVNREGMINFRKQSNPFEKNPSKGKGGTNWPVSDFREATAVVGQKKLTSEVNPPHDHKRSNNMEVKDSPPWEGGGGPLLK